MSARPRLRLVYVLDRFPALSETFVIAELRELVRRGEDVRIVARERGDGVPAPEELVGRTRYVPRNRVSLARAVLRLLVTQPRRALSALAWTLRALPHERGAWRVLGEAAYVAPRLGRVDHLHAHFAHTSTSLALLISRLRARPFSFTGHAYDVFVATPPALLRRKIDAARFVVAVSEFTREWLAQIASGDERASVVAVRNGVELSAFGTPARGEPEIPTVLTVARLVDKKGIDVALHASALLAERGVEDRWLVVGDGPRRAALEQLARRLGVARHVTFAGARPNNETRALLRNATAFVLPCRVAPDGDRDAAPAAIVEAFAAAVPVVSTPVGGVRELTNGGDAGLLVPPDDPDALAAALARLLSDDKLRARFARAGRRVAEERHDVRASVARVTELMTGSVA